MDTRKVLLFIVEGPSDEAALAPALEKIINTKKVKFKVMRIDITSDYDSNVGNIERRIKDLGVKKFLEQNSQFKPEDICGIVHIVDLDGAFISKNKIFEQDVEKNVYCDDSILCKSRDEFLTTIENKKNNLLYLSSLTDIKIPYGIIVPYVLYYMSCNLDHVLHGKRNSTQDEKKNDSIDFADQYDEPSMFIKFFNDETIKVTGTYLETWEYVQRGNNSLSRCTNFWLCLENFEHFPNKN